ncbi:MAG: mechanosensitive ion channel family protein [Clostridiaceae bacterium]|jgi:MscS family membrane protein|nr:mechanosensitive ion channel family protein [Clostridiaceae bacterium]
MEDIKLFWGHILELFTHTFLNVEIWRIVAVGFVLILTFALRKLFVNFLVGLFKKMTSKTKTTFDDQLVDAVDPPARLLLVAAGLSVSFKVLQIPVEYSLFLNRIVRSIVIFSAFWAIYRGADIITEICERAVRKTNTELDDLLLPFISKGIKIIVVVLGISVIAKEWSYDLGAILAGLGLGGLAFALAAQETLANFFGGVTIMVDKPFVVGEIIKASGVEGTVEDIGFRSTRVRTFDQGLITVPNSVLAKGPVTNVSKMGKRRVSFNLGIKYSTNISNIENLLNRIRTMLSEHSGIHSDPIHVYFSNFGDSALELSILYYTKAIDYRNFMITKEDVNLKIMRILDEMGIEVAFPSASVYIEKEK